MWNINAKNNIHFFELIFKIISFDLQKWFSYQIAAVLNSRMKQNDLNDYYASAREIKNDL